MPGVQPEAGGGNWNGMSARRLPYSLLGHFHGLDWGRVGMTYSANTEWSERNVTRLQHTAICRRSIHGQPHRISRVRQFAIYAGLWHAHGPEGTAPELAHPNVSVILPDGSERYMTLHVINGTRAEIKARLLESVDAFFDIHAEL
jgi:hypothetical protein